jgi:hypothetical protein
MLFTVKLTISTVGLKISFQCVSEAQSRQSARLFLQSSELGFPSPSPAGKCAPPPPLWFRGGWAHSLVGEGAGVPFRLGDIHCGNFRKNWFTANPFSKSRSLIGQIDVCWLCIIQCCGCLSRIPDPTFFHPGSELSPSRTPKKWFLSSRKYDPGCLSRIPDPDADFYPSRIPDPGVKKAPDPGSGSATLVSSPTNNVVPRLKK